MYPLFYYSFNHISVIISWHSQTNIINENDMLLQYFSVLQWQHVLYVLCLFSYANYNTSQTVGHIRNGEDWWPNADIARLKLWNF